MTEQAASYQYSAPSDLLAKWMAHLAIWRNPILWKNYHSRMRVQALFSFLFVLIISSFTTFTIYGGAERFAASTVEGARAAIVPMALIQWFILMLAATGRITSGIIHERVTGTIEYTRLTPLSPIDKVLGYLFGLPVREYLVFFCTMPFMIFLLIAGEIPLSVVIPVYLVFFSSAILFHMVGMVLGLVLKEWRLSVVFTVALVIAINWILPFFSYLGFPILQYLTVRPVFVEKIIPLLPANSVPSIEGAPALITELTAGVDFYTWEVSTTAFSLILQGLLIFTLALMVYRKWENDFGHALSKLYALFFYIALQLFCIGTMWPNLTFNTDNLIAIGMNLDDSPIEGYAFLIPMIYGAFSIGIACWLVYIITPSHEEYRSGLLRSQKLRHMGQAPLSRFDDNAGSSLTTAALALTTFGFLLVVELVMTRMGPLGEVSPDTIGLLRLPLVALLVTIYFAVAVEYLQFTRFALLFLMVWIVPVLLAIFIAVVFDMEEDVLYVASGSPFTLVILSAQGLLTDWMDREEMEIVRNAYWVGISFVGIITGFFAYRLKKLKDRTRAQILSVDPAGA
jgi:hypothetical protein